MTNASFKIKRLYKPRKKDGWLGIVVALVVFVLYAFQQGWIDAGTKKLSQNPPGYYRITKFIDGDTIAIDMNGREERVRMIGIDTPETHKPNTPVQCYGPAAAAFTKNTIGSQSVRLEADALSGNRDRYERLLRYVYLADGTLLNEKIIRGGYGFYYPYFPFSKSQQFSAAQEQARQDNKGLWGNCSPKPTNGGGWLSNNMES